MNRLMVRILGITATLIMAAGCETGDSTSTAPGSGVELRPPGSNVVCDPFGGDPALQGRGLLGNLYYLSDDQPRYPSAKDYVTYGHPVDADLYFNELNTPTRPFDRGFVNQNGEVFLNANGTTLYEYFGIHLETNFELAPEDAPGDYQFAMLTDDGSVLEVSDSLAGYRVLVNNDGVHPTRLGCSTTPVYFSGEAEMPMKIDYYQGPRFHIALMLLYRPWPTVHPVNDPHCGTQGNSRFFDSTQNPPTPQAAYNDLMSRGWKQATWKNYKLPGFNNPCVVGEPPVISDVAVSNITSNSVDISWTTDIPSTSQAAFAVSGSGSYSFSTEDSGLTTTHNVTLSGLSTFTLYDFYVISKGADNQSSQSAPNTFRTLR
ncbi:MAG: fibronectin type III domain-containing protein [Oligoflexia bacterium]|nr:fibronectin type III domain-containing protein [Oligoflexia bacterium]